MRHEGRVLDLQMAQLGTQKGTVPKSEIGERSGILHQAPQGYIRDTGTAHCAKVVCHMSFLRNFFLTLPVTALQLTQLAIASPSFSKQIQESVQCILYS